MESKAFFRKQKCLSLTFTQKRWRKIRSLTHCVQFLFAGHIVPPEIVRVCCLVPPINVHKDAAHGNTRSFLEVALWPHAALPTVKSRKPQLSGLVGNCLDRSLPSPSTTTHPTSLRLSPKTSRPDCLDLYKGRSMLERTTSKNIRLCLSFMFFLNNKCLLGHFKNKASEIKLLSITDCGQASVAPSEAHFLLASSKVTRLSTMRQHMPFVPIHPKGQPGRSETV